MRRRHYCLPAVIKRAMFINEMQREILRLKKEKDICILAHSYEPREVCEVADFTGDSYALSVKAKSVKSKTVLMCGVRFMAETVKILSPDKRVILSHPQAGCPMAEQFTPADILALKEKYPGAAVAAYVNTTAQLKAVCDVCVTSSCAVKVVSAMPQKDILFVPDCNLGAFVAANCPDKNIILMPGGCPEHAKITKADALAAKAAHPNALFLVHPECKAEVTSVADYTGSTAGIMEFAKSSSAGAFIIGTENSIVSHLRYECPEKQFYPVSKELICSNMRLTDLPQVYACVAGNGGEEIELDADIMNKARRCIDKMIEYGG